MSLLATSIADHPRLIVGVLASTCIIVRIVVPGRPFIRTLRVEVLLLISLSLDSTLFIEIVISFLHRPFYIHRGVIQVHVEDVLAHENPLLNIRVEPDFKTVHLWLFVIYKCWGQMGESHEFEGIL